MRRQRHCLLRVACCVAAAVGVVIVPQPSAGSATRVPVGSWSRPVVGAVVRPFVAPRSRYGPGHRGADLAAAPGAPVVAPGAGRVTFAGSVAGTRHVVIDHGQGVRTSLSFLATIAVRAGQTVARGQPVGSTGGTGPDHDGRAVHLGLRVGDTYVDPMRLFAPLDLAAVVHLVPVRDRMRRAGLATPAAESRALADSLYLPQHIPGLEPAPEPDIWDRAAGALGAAWSGVRTVGTVAGAPLVLAWHAIVRYTPVGTAVSDLRAMGSRLVAHLRSRSDCTEDAAPPPGGGGSGHLLFAVGGIDSRTDPVTGATFALDTAGLGYRSGEVGWFSYRRDGGAYRPVHTYGDLLQAAFSLRDQLRVFARAHPGREVDLVAHSQGGVVVDAFLEVVDDPADPGLPPLGTVLTLASPHQGAPLAAVATELRSGVNGRRVLTAIDTAAGGAIPPSSGRSTRQLAPGSALMRRLAAAPLPDGIDLTSLGGVDDVVVPATATDKRGAQAVTTNPAGPGDHSAILRDPQAIGAARLALEQRAAPCVGWADGVRDAVEPVLIRRAELSVGTAVHRALDPPVVVSPIPRPVP